MTWSADGLVTKKPKAAKIYCGAYETPKFSKDDDSSSESDTDGNKENNTDSNTDSLSSFVAEHIDGVVVD